MIRSLEKPLSLMALTSNSSTFKVCFCGKIQTLSERWYPNKSHVFITQSKQYQFTANLAAFNSYPCVPSIPYSIKSRTALLKHHFYCIKFIHYENEIQWLYVNLQSRKNIATIRPENGSEGKAAFLPSLRT